MEKKELLICECHSTDHQMIFLYDDEDIDYKTVYIHTHLAKKGFWERLKYGIKYIFGYQSRYGAFDEFIIDSKDIDKFQSVVDYLNKCKDCTLKGDINE